MFVSPASSNTDEIIIVLQSRKSLNGGVLKQIVENATEEEDLKDLNSTMHFRADTKGGRKVG